MLSKDRGKGVLWSFQHLKFLLWERMILRCLCTDVTTLQIDSYSGLDSSGIPRGNQSETRPVYSVYYW